MDPGIKAQPVDVHDAARRVCRFREGGLTTRAVPRGTTTWLDHLR